VQEPQIKLLFVNRFVNRTLRDSTRRGRRSRLDQNGRRASAEVNIQVPGLGVAVGDRGYVLAAGGVLPGKLSVVSGMISGRDRCAAGGAARGSA
jgi:hypothetical protein